MESIVTNGAFGTAEVASMTLSPALAAAAPPSAAARAEFSSFAAYVDYPEAEDFNQYGGIDIFHLHTAGQSSRVSRFPYEAGAVLRPSPPRQL